MASLDASTLIQHRPKDICDRLRSNLSQIFCGRCCRGMFRPACRLILYSILATQTYAALPQTAPMGSSPREPAESLLTFEGPPPPVPPEVISRDPASGRATVRAVRVTEPWRLDGQLDEAVYTNVPSMSDFIQMEPHAGSLATEKTEVWILFDDKNVYVTFRCWESHPERMVVNEMRHDNSNLWLGDNIAFMFDTFHDRRNGVEFGVAPNGGRYEGQITDERQYNGDWNPVWDVAVGRFSNGWTVETAIPFKSMRYRSGQSQIWGFQARRINTWKNELSFLTRLPPSLGMGRGIFAASLAPAVVGLETPAASRNLDVKPYFIADRST